MPMLLLSIAMMVGQLPTNSPAPEVQDRVPNHVANSTVSRNAKVSVRILSPARVGAAYVHELVPGGQRVSIVRKDSSGVPHTIHALEFE